MDRRALIGASAPEQPVPTRRAFRDGTMDAGTPTQLCSSNQDVLAFDTIRNIRGPQESNLARNVWGRCQSATDAFSEPRESDTSTDAPIRRSSPKVELF